MSSKTKTVKKPIVTVALALILVVAAVAGTLTYMASSKAAVKDTGELAFTLDAEATPGWWTSGNLRPADGLTDDYIGDPDELPVVDMIVHQGKDRTDATGDCFVSVSYFDQVIDLKAALKQSQESVTLNNDELSLKKVGAQTLSIKSPDGSQEYQVHQYNLVGDHDKNTMHGIEFGFITLEDGHIAVRGNCTTAGQLKNTLPVLDAVSLIKS